MKNLTLLFLAFFIATAWTQTSKKPFEGKIIYKITFSAASDNVKYNEYQKQKYGSMVEYLYSEKGDYKIVYKTSGIKGYDFILFNKSLNKIYTKFKNIDTIYSYSPNENSLNLLSQNEGQSINIKGKSCKVLNIIGEEPKSKQKVKLTYTYPINAEYLNPNNYRNYKDFFLDKIMAITQAPFYKLEMNMTKYVLVFDLTSIESKPLNLNEFILPKNIFVK
jgi:hypothetical protein